MAANTRVIGENMIDKFYLEPLWNSFLTIFWIQSFLYLMKGSVELRMKLQYLVQVHSFSQCRSVKF